jgi:hypothetical protein
MARRWVVATALVVVAACSAFGSSSSPDPPASLPDGSATGTNPANPAYAAAASVNCSDVTCLASDGFCCVAANGGDHCIDAGACGSAGTGTVAVYCDDGRDCTPGFACCMRMEVDNVTISSVGCEARCDGPHAYRVCGGSDSNTCDAGAGEQCVPLSNTVRLYTPPVSLRVCQ